MDKERKLKSSTIPYVIVFVLGFIIIGLLLYIVPVRYGLNVTVPLDATDEELDNPLTGYAPWGENVEECADSRLVYIQVLWSEWEPTMDIYDVETLETKFHIARWKAAGKNAVLRFVCDVPGEEEHMDIPRWLYSRTRDGVYYDSPYGKGYCPDYGNTYFRERHALAIQALADYCNRDDFVAYVELGSLGHWGEWHTDTDSGALPLPDAEICNEYILDYSDSFHNARLLTRRNYEIAVDGGLGFYNDMVGDSESMEEWLDWMRDGGTFETAGKPLKLKTVQRFWDTAPVGGEITGQFSMEELFARWLDITTETVERCHMSFLGPSCPTGELAQSDAARKLRERLGYRYYISQYKMEYSFSHDKLKIELTWSNTGLAPLYWDWPAMLYVYDKEDEEPIFWQTLNLALSEVTPEKRVVTETYIPYTDVLRKGFQVGIGIVSPDEKNHVKLAMDGEMRDNIQIIYTYKG